MTLEKCTQQHIRICVLFNVVVVVVVVVEIRSLSHGCKKAAETYAHPNCMYENPINKMSGDDAEQSPQSRRALVHKPTKDPLHELGFGDELPFGFPLNQYMAQHPMPFIDFLLLHKGWQCFFDFVVVFWTLLYAIPWLAVKFQDNTLYNFDVNDTWLRFGYGVMIPLSVCTIFMPITFYFFAWYMNGGETETLANMKDVKDAFALGLRIALLCPWRSVGWIWGIEMAVVMTQIWAYGTAGDVNPNSAAVPLTVFGATDQPWLRFSALVVITCVYAVAQFILLGIMGWLAKLMKVKQKYNEANKTNNPYVHAMWVHTYILFVNFEASFWAVFLGINVVNWGVATWWSFSLPYIQQDAAQIFNGMFVIWAVAICVRFVASYLMKFTPGYSTVDLLEGKWKMNVLGDIAAMILWSFPSQLALIAAFWETFSVVPGMSSAFGNFDKNGTAQAGAACITNNPYGAPGSTQAFPNYLVYRYPWWLTGNTFLVTMVVFAVVVIVSFCTHGMRGRGLLPSTARTAFAAMRAAGDAAENATLAVPGAIVDYGNGESAVTSVSGEALRAARGVTRLARATAKVVPGTMSAKQIRDFYLMSIRAESITNFFALIVGFVPAYFSVTGLASGLMHSANQPYNVPCAYPYTASAGNTLGAVIIVILLQWFAHWGVNRAFPVFGKSLAEKVQFKPGFT